MQVVIDVDDKVYERLRNSEVLVSGLRSGKCFLSKVCMAVANGVVLPKGHTFEIAKDGEIIEKC